MTQKYIDNLSYEIMGAAIEVHKIMGPGLLEKVYRYCMIQELMIRNIVFHTEKTIPVDYKSMRLDLDFRCDFLVDSCIVVELKSVKEILPIYEAQVITYTKLLKVPKGILINFNCRNLFHEGQKTFVNEFYRNLDFD